MPSSKTHTAVNKERCLEAWLANPLADFQTIAKAAQVCDMTFYRYRQDASFMAEYHKRQRERFAGLEGKAIALLENEMDNGNWNAIKYTLDGNGYKPTDKVEVQQTTITVGFEDEKNETDL